MLLYQKNNNNNNNNNNKIETREWYSTPIYYIYKLEGIPYCRFFVFSK